MNPFAILDQSYGGDDLTGPPAVVSSPSSPNAIQHILPRPKPLPSEGSQNKHSITSTPRRPLSTSSSSKLSQIGSIKAVAKVIQGPVTKEPETKDEERERFKLLYKDEKIVTFKRGGVEAAAEEDDQALEVVNEETAEEEAEQADESDENDNEDEVSNEDRIVSRYVFDAYYCAKTFLYKT